MEQAIKSYESSTIEEDAEAEQIILELPEIRKRFETYLQDKKFSLKRLIVGDILPEFDEILKVKGCTDFYMRAIYFFLIFLTTIIIFGCVQIYEINLQILPILIWSFIVLAISYFRLSSHIVNRNLFYTDREYEILPNRKLIQLNEILEPELIFFHDKFFKLWLWLWVQLQMPPRTYGQNLSNAIWPLIKQTIDICVKDFSTLEVLLKANESDGERYKLALSMGINQRVNKAQYLKDIQLIDRAQFKAIRGTLKLIVADVSLLYDTFMKNYGALNLGANQNLQHNFY